MGCHFNMQSLLSTCFSAPNDVSALHTSGGSDVLLLEVDGSCSVAQDTQWTAEFSMLGKGVSLGDHYIRQVNKVEKSCTEEVDAEEYEEPVIQEVVHEDLMPSEVAVDPLEASVVEHELWASQVE